MDIGENLIKARKNKGLSQEDVSNELNVSRQSVSLWENNQTFPSVDNLIALSKLYDVSISALYGQEEIKDNNAMTNNYFADQQNITNNNNNQTKVLKPFTSSPYWFLTIMSIVSLTLASLCVRKDGLMFFFSLVSFVFALASRSEKKNNLNLILIVFAIFYLAMSFIGIKL